MPEALPPKIELIMAGLGGMGVLVAGRLLARAALQRYQYVSWVPSYGHERRGGMSECTTILSGREIASPILDQAQTVILLDSSQLKVYEGRVRPNGLLIAEKASLKDRPERTDIRLLAVSGLEIAMGMGGVLLNSLILLGFYIQMARPLPAELVQEELDRLYSDKQATLKRNKDAFRQGLELAQKTTV